MSGEEFGRLSLAEFNALGEVYLTDRKHKDWRTALVVATLANLLGEKKDGRPWRPEDIMPWLSDAKGMAAAKADELGPPQSPEEMRAIVERITREMGGIVKPGQVPLDAGQNNGLTKA